MAERGRYVTLDKDQFHSNAFGHFQRRLSRRDKHSPHNLKLQKGVGMESVPIALSLRLSISVWLLCLFICCGARAADPPEADAAFNAAVKAFQDKYYEIAEKQFGEYVTKYPQSPRVPDVVLLQAQCRFELKNHNAVIDLLTKLKANAGKLADQYQYWIAEAQFHRPDLAAASQSYGELLAAHPDSPLRLQASYGQAFSQYKLGNFSRTVELLKDPASAFQRASQNNTNEAFVIRGYLLLGEALFEQKSYRTVQETLSVLTNRNLTAEVDWQRQSLIAHSAFADQRAAEALTITTNLIALAVAADKPVLHASSLILQAEILQRIEPEQAIQAYEKITQIKGAAPSQSRQALLRAVDLEIARDRLTNAVTRLENLLSQNPQDAIVDLIRLTLGELRLKQFYALMDKSSPPSGPATAAAATNLLHQAKTNLTFIINVRTNSELLGKAYLNQGWSLWEEGRLTATPARIGESRAAFEAAVARLTVPEDRAVARFKLADCQLEQNDPTNAILNYELLIENHSDLRQAKTNLFNLALDNLLRASVRINDLARARAALQRNLDWFPTNLLSHQGMLTYGQALLDDSPGEARSALSDFLRRFTNSPIVPDVQLAIAKSHAYETNWVSAIQEYDRWIGRYTNHISFPHAAFDQAWVYYRSGDETNALKLFTNYVARFPTNNLAPLAQYWVADYFYRQQAWDTAEINYKLLIQNTNLVNSDLGHQSRLMAGKSAFFRLAYDNARDYLAPFVSTFGDVTNPPPAVLEAFMVLGDVELSTLVTGETNRWNKYGNAITVFSRVATKCGVGTRWEPLARGKMAACHVQLAEFDPSRLDAAATNYYQAMISRFADVTTRSEAQVGFGHVLELQAKLKPEPARRALLEQALEHYLKAFYAENEKRPDPYWVKTAGLKAADLAVHLNLYDQAKRTYTRLLNQLPSLSQTIEAKLQALEKAEPR